MSFISYRVVSTSFPPGNPFHKRVSACGALETPGNISQPTAPFPHWQVPKHLRFASVMQLGARSPAIRANRHFYRWFDEKVDPAGAYQLVVDYTNIGKVQEFCQFRIRGHLLTSAIKVVGRCYKICALVSADQFFPLMSEEPKLLSVGFVQIKAIQL
jgi:hypothetical protein